MKLWQLERQARRLPLPRTPKAVLVIMISYSSKTGDGTCIYPSLEIVALEASCSVRTAQRAVRWLEAEGWIEAVYSKGGRGRSNGWHLQLDEFGLAARPPAIQEPLPADPSRRLAFVRGVLRRLKPESAARPRWLEEQEQLEQELGLSASSPVIDDQAGEASTEIIEERPPAAPEKLEEQRQTLTDKIAWRESQRDSFSTGTPAWRRWNDLVEKGRQALNALISCQSVGEYAT